MVKGFSVLRRKSSDVGKSQYLWTNNVLILLRIVNRMVLRRRS